MRRPRRNHSSVFKAKAGIAAIKGDQTLDPLRCQKVLQRKSPKKLVATGNAWISIKQPSSGDPRGARYPRQIRQAAVLLQYTSCSHAVSGSATSYTGGRGHNHRAMYAGKYQFGRIDDHQITNSFRNGFISDHLASLSESGGRHRSDRQFVYLIVKICARSLVCAKSITSPGRWLLLT